MSRRMNALIDMCPVCVTAADIGCDHGLISAGLVIKGRAEKVIAADISAPSLAKARAYADSLGIAVETRLGSGLSVLKEGEADAAVIAGMGAELIAAILRDGKKTAASIDAFVLSPHIYPERLREFLLENGYYIEEERCIAEDGRMYAMMLARHGSTEQYSAGELRIGRADTFSEGYELGRSAELARIRKIILDIRAAGADASYWESVIRSIEEAEK